MPIPEPGDYLSDLTAILRRHWPENRTVQIVCHGHSVPAGYFATPMVDSLNAYPHLLFTGLKQRFPFAVINVIVTAIGGENSEAGAVRFQEEALTHRPDLVTMDYALNDRMLGLARAEAAWRRMIEATLSAGSKAILLTPTADKTQLPSYEGPDKEELEKHADQIRKLAAEYGVGLADNRAAFQAYVCRGGRMSDLLSWGNHPNRAGHEIVARELLRWLPPAAGTG